MWKPWLIFVAIFGLFFGVSLYTFEHAFLLDHITWFETVEHFLEFNPMVREEMTYGYPGTPPLLLAAALQRWFGLLASDAFVLSMSFLVAISSSGCAMLMYLLKPTSWWWLAGSVILGLRASSSWSTPPSIAVAPFIVLIFLLCLYIPHQTKSRSVFIWLGIALGISLACRVDVSGLAALIAFIYLRYEKASWQRLGLAAITAFITFVVTDPYMFWMPIQHLQDIFYKIFFHYSLIEENRLSIELLLLKGPLTLLSFLFGIGILLRGTSTFPKSFLLAIIGFSTSLALIIFSSTYQPLWYFLPIILLWETLLPAFVLPLAYTSEFSFVPRQIRVGIQGRAEFYLASLLLVGYAMTFLQLLF